MAVQIIPAILARGYGVSVQDVKFIPGENEDYVNMIFPEKQSKGELLLGFDDESNAVIPLIRIDNYCTVCIAFTVYVPDVGWKGIDITALPGNMNELQDKTSYETMELKMIDPPRDMSGYEIINAWEA